MALTSAAGNTYYRSGYVTTVSQGTLLVNNASGSGTGGGAVAVSAGATLGGTGTIYGLQGNVTLTGTADNSLATLAPGSLDASGAGLLGTLTVGDAAQNNSVTFANYTRLLAQLGSASLGDQLKVIGNLNLNSAANKDYLALSTLTGATVNGTYTLATFTGTLTGRFDGVTLDGNALPGGYDLQYRDTTNQVVSGTGNIAGGSIVLVVPEPATIGMALGLGALTLLRRRRRVRD
jgi:hypothetical protein